MPNEINLQNYLNSTAADSVHPMFIKCARAIPTYDGWTSNDVFHVFYCNGTLPSDKQIPWNTNQTDFVWTSLRLTSPDEVINLLDGLTLAQQFFAQVTATCNEHSATATIYYLVLWPEIPASISE